MKTHIILALFMGLLSLPLQTICQQVPGDIVTYVSVDEGKYIGSPSLAILPNGDYVASHDFFGPKSSEWQQAVSRIFVSKDKGKKWRQVSTIHGAFWSSLFVHKGDLYLLGPDRHHGTVLIRKSTDGGKTWTQPTNKENGVILTGEFHCAPMPVVEYNGRLWRPMETAHGPILEWGKRYGAMVMSADINADLLNAKSWQVSNSVPYNSEYLNGNFGGWLEGNFVVGRDNQLWNVLRVDNKNSLQEKAAFLELSTDGKELKFDKETGFVDFPGGSKKFVIKFDEKSGEYYTLANVIPEKYSSKYPNRNPATFRNVLMLRKSKDLKNWVDVKTILENEDVINHGFQYVDWLFDGNDIIVLSRTAFFDGKKNARNNHDANYLTFHRIEKFRSL
ncbi:sialidase family protein [Sphingobacterium daejeonense]|uniref:Sialidase family protein n=1 Tax=Sphingobacterium daejeonense TaxID=371142 RepID=A0ABW3RKK3_9SPHI|nr:sialidase family protein [Sphingobacterium daejeonense]MCT1530173.1 glycoside hydrolase [Sphingobacterium daejeonense]